MINNSDGRRMREEFCQCAENILDDLILPEWSKETDGLDLVNRREKEDSNDPPPLSEEESIRQAEEFICLIYPGYLQNLLARMRTMVLQSSGSLQGLRFRLGSILTFRARL
jgi:hypothetical protein